MQILIFASLALLYLAACLRKSLSRQMKGQLIGEEFHERDKSTTANIFARIQSRRVALYRRLFNIRDENFASFYHNWRYDGGGPIIVLLAEENSEFRKLPYRGESCILWVWAGNYLRNSATKLNWKQRYGIILVQYQLVSLKMSLMFKIWSLQRSRNFIWHDRNKFIFAISLEEFLSL